MYHHHPAGAPAPLTPHPSAHSHAALARAVPHADLPLLRATRVCVSEGGRFA